MIGDVQKRKGNILTNFWRHFPSVNWPTWHENKNRKVHKTLHFMIGLIIKLFILSHISLLWGSEWCLLLDSQEGLLNCFDDRQYFFFLVPASNRNLLLTDVLWIRVKLLGGWALYFLLLLQSSTAMIFGRRALISTANALIWGLLTLLCFIAASSVLHQGEFLEKKMWCDNKSEAKFPLQFFHLGAWN